MSSSDRMGLCLQNNIESCIASGQTDMLALLLTRPELGPEIKREVLCYFETSRFDRDITKL